MPRNPDLPCAGCGKLIWRRKGMTLPAGQAMCNPCRRARPHSVNGHALRMGTCPRCGGHALPGRYCSMVCSSPARQAKIRESTGVRICLDCPAEFTGGHTRKRCPDCAKARRSDCYRRKSALRRSSGRGYRDHVTGETITIAQLGDRDTWTCWLCHDFVNRTLSNGDPWMPSFDHVVPISLGGLDSLDNLRLAHLTCNVKRGNRVAV